MWARSLALLLMMISGKSRKCLHGAHSNPVVWVSQTAAQWADATAAACVSPAIPCSGRIDAYSGRPIARFMFCVKNERGGGGGGGGGSTFVFKPGVKFYNLIGC